MIKTFAAALLASAVAGNQATVFGYLGAFFLKKVIQKISKEKQPDLCADLQDDMTSLGSALIGDEKKAYDYAYLSCIDLKKQKCLRKGPTDEEANRKWSNIVIDLFKYQTDLDQQLLSDRTFYVNCGSANALAGSLIAVALAIYAITF